MASIVKTIENARDRALKEQQERREQALAALEARAENIERDFWDDDYQFARRARPAPPAPPPPDPNAVFDPEWREVTSMGGGSTSWNVYVPRPITRLKVPRGATGGGTYSVMVQNKNGRNSAQGEVQRDDPSVIELTEPIPAGSTVYIAQCGRDHGGRIKLFRFVRERALTNPQQPRAQRPLLTGQAARLNANGLPIGFSSDARIDNTPPVAEPEEPATVPAAPGRRRIIVD